MLLREMVGKLQETLKYYVWVECAKLRKATVNVKAGCSQSELLVGNSDIRNLRIFLRKSQYFSVTISKLMFGRVHILVRSFSLL